MGLTALLSKKRKDSSQSAALTQSERRSMERATTEMHEEAARLLADRPKVYQRPEHRRVLAVG